MCAVSPAATITIKARNTIKAYTIPDFHNWPRGGTGEDEGDDTHRSWKCNRPTDFSHIQNVLGQTWKRNWLPCMPTFRFGGKASEPPTRGSALDNVGGSALKFASSPLTTSGSNHGVFTLLAVITCTAEREVHAYYSRQKNTYTFGCYWWTEDFPFYFP